MSERFFSQQPITGDRVTLDGPEAHHLLHVMRAAVGERLTLFDNSGAEFDAVVENLGRAEASLRIIARREINRELPFPLVVGVALPKGDRQKWLVEKLTELGVAALVPLVTERGVAQPAASAIERLKRNVMEASKQCGRNRLMEIREPQLWKDWLASEPGWLASSPPAADEPPVRRLVAHPGGTLLHELDVSRQLPTQLAIGPEGGFTEAEVASVIAVGWQPVDLGPRIIRVETAAIALVAAITLG
jgi:16S rRNA (uracil1498-N3)-methyltransferase